MPRMILSPYLVLGALVASAGPVMAGASVRSANPQAPLTLHATPRIAGKLPIPDVEALFIGTLTGRGLSWRLTFHGLSNEVVSAQLLPVAANHSGAIGVKLCDPCTSGQAGTTSLSQTAVAATRRSNAYVELRSTKRPQVGIRGQIRPGAVPTLELLSPADGDTITLPTAVRFAISGYKPINGDGHIQAILREGSERIIIDLQQSKEPGLAYLPANKLLSGRRDLTFTLTTADGTPLKNAEAGATVRALTIEGGRSAGIAVSGSASGAATSSTVASGTLSTTAGSGPASAAPVAGTAPITALAAAPTTAAPDTSSTTPKAAAVPTLAILSPRDGDTITLPAAIRFAITGFSLGDGGHIQATMQVGTERVSVALQPGAETGLAYLPANKNLTGKRDLTFTLTKADGASVGNPEAQVTLHGLIIEGGR